MTSAQEKKHSYDFNKLQKRIRREVGQAVTDYNMIEQGDLVMVCLSGGADSYTMLDSCSFTEGCANSF